MEDSTLDRTKCRGPRARATPTSSPIHEPSFEIEGSQLKDTFDEIFRTEDLPIRQRVEKRVGLGERQAEQTWLMPPRDHRRGNRRGRRRLVQLRSMHDRRTAVSGG